MPALLFVTSVLMRMYPAQWRALWAAECLSTFQATCAHTAASSGPIGVVRHAMAEWVDLVRGAVRARRGVLVTSGAPQRRNDRRRPSFGSTLRTAVRSLRAAPGHTAIAVVTLALGIGANAGLFSVLDSLLIRPVPFAHGDRLVELHNHSIAGGVTFPGMSRALTERWREQTDLFDRVESFSTDFAMYQGPEGIELDDMAYVSPQLLSMLGVAPLQGRLFAPFSGAAPDEVILSERVWRSTFGAKPDIVGSTLTVNGRSLHVIGLMPSWFHFPSNGVAMWRPSADGGADGRGAYVMARIAPDRAHDAVAATVRERGSRLSTEAGGDAGVTAVVYRRSERDAQQVRSLQVLAGAVAFLLLIVCANLSNLSLTKALSQARDAGVRAALGASRGDLIREGLAEQFLIGVMGAATGVLVAAGVVALAVDALPSAMTMNVLNPIDLDGRTMTLIAAAGLFTPLLFGLPAVWLRGASDVAVALAQQSRGSTLSRTAVRWRNVMVVAEVTLALVLLVGAALMARSVYALVAVDRGFDTTGLVTLTLGLPGAGYRDPAVRDAWTGQLITEARRIPGVSAVTAGGVPPRPSGQNFGRLEFAHQPGEAFGPMSLPVYRAWPDYFQQIGLRLIEGRSFAFNESSDSIIVSESFAKRFWPEGSAIGGQFRFTGSTAWFAVVGVATDVRQHQLDDAEGAFEVFRPLQGQPARRVSNAVIEEHRTIVARASNEAAAIEELRRTVRRLDPTVVLWSGPATVDEAFSTAIAQPRLILIVLAALGGLGLVLAAAGLYGVLSYLVTTRVREFGLRLALGANPASVFQLILRYGLVLTSIGVGVGVVAALALVRVMQSLLYDVEASDPLALGAVGLTLIIVAIAACWLPARRAMKVDPVSLLRD